MAGSAPDPDVDGAYRHQVERWRAERQLAVDPARPPTRGRCEHCHTTATPSYWEGPSRRYCSERCRRAGTYRARLGLPRDILPGATLGELRRLSASAAPAESGAQAPSLPRWSTSG
jgi:hypothetical protein